MINALQNYLSGGQLEAGNFTILIITNEYKFHRINFQILINTMGFFLQIKGAYMYVSRFFVSFVGNSQLPFLQLNFQY